MKQKIRVVRRIVKEFYIPVGDKIERDKNIMIRSRFPLAKTISDEYIIVNEMPMVKE